MNISQSFRLAVKSLATSKMRALLTMLGIIIGVAAVIIITSLGNGMQNYMNDQFESMGSNLVQVQIYGRGMGSSRTIEPEDMYALAEKYPDYISGVTPYVTAQAKVRQGTEEYERTSLYGVGESFLGEQGSTMRGETLATGRFLKFVDVDRFQNVCVIGAYLAQNAFSGDPLGQTISIGGMSYTVVGVLDTVADLSEGSGDDIIYIPYTSALRLNGMADANFYMFTSTTRDTASAAKGIIENRLYQTSQSSDYYFLMTSAEMMEAMDSMVHTSKRFRLPAAKSASRCPLVLSW